MRLQEGDDEMLEFKKGAFFSAINAYSKCLFSEDLFYIEATKHITFFSSITIESYENKYNEDLIAYAIFNIKKRKKTDRIIAKKIKPIVMKILKKFKEKYNRKSFTDVTKFDDFSTELEIVLKNITYN